MACWPNNWRLIVEQRLGAELQAERDQARENVRQLQAELGDLRTQHGTRNLSWVSRSSLVAHCSCVGQLELERDRILAERADMARAVEALEASLAAASNEKKNSDARMMELQEQLASVHLELESTIRQSNETRANSVRTLHSCV